MAKIESLTTFRNQRYLSDHKGNRLRRGEVAEVPDRYAEQMVERGLAVYADEDAEVSADAGTGRSGASAGEASSAEYSIGGHHAGGFYHLLYGGEQTGETVGRGKDTADEIADELNAEDVDPADLSDWLT
jgi:hypothetical protein